MVRLKMIFAGLEVISGKGLSMGVKSLLRGLGLSLKTVVILTSRSEKFSFGLFFIRTNY